MSLKADGEHRAIDITALASSPGAGVSAAAAAGATGEGVAVPILAALPAGSNAYVPTAGGVHAAVEDLVMSASVASDRHVQRTRAVHRRRILVTLVVGTALAAGGGARIPAAGAVMAALELEVMVVGAADGVRGHARVAAALLVTGAVGGVAVVRAGLQQALGDHVRDSTQGFLGCSLAGATVDRAGGRSQHNLGRTNRLQRRWVLHTFVFAADAPLARTRIAAARAAGSAGEVVAVLVETAGPALADADVTAAGRINSACEICSIRVGARLAQLILALGLLRHRVQITGTIRAALAARCGARVSTALAVLVALEVHPSLVQAALRIEGDAQASAALEIVGTNEVDVVVRAHMERSFRVQFRSLKFSLPSTACMGVLLKHGRRIRIKTVTSTISGTGFLVSSGGGKGQANEGRTANEHVDQKKCRAAYAGLC